MQHQTLNKFVRPRAVKTRSSYNARGLTSFDALADSPSKKAFQDDARRLLQRKGPPPAEQPVVSDEAEDDG